MATDDLILGPWIDGIAFVYRVGLRKDDKGKKIIIGAWHGNRYYALHEIYGTPWIHEVYHKQVNKDTEAQLKGEANDYIKHLG
jgi:hypothetical protein